MCKGVNIENRRGWTDYIDFIKLEEVDYPVMSGIDCYQRHFIVVKMIVDNEIIIQTFFQRYTNGNLWMVCGHATLNLIETSGGMKPEQIKLINDIIDGKTIKLTENLRPASDYLTNKKVRLYDEKKEKASKVIQEAWRKCRYNPCYKMCHKIEIDNLKNMEIEFKNKILI